MNPTSNLSYNDDGEKLSLMKLLIFGASGRTGHALIDAALENAYDVTAFVREPSRLTIRHPRLEVATGDVADYQSILDVIQSDHAVISVLGAASPFKRDPALLRGIRNITRVMQLKGARRLIYLSFAGVKDSRQQLGFLFRWFALPILVNVSADHEEKEDVIRQSALQWTIARPALLTNGVRTGNLRAGVDLKPTLAELPVSRTDVADFMLQELTGDRFLKKAPLLIGSRDA